MHTESLVGNLLENSNLEDKEGLDYNIQTYNVRI
jgi:hypothetical protein